jgi:RHH-type transcriptional regulator, proline utilization regulon repressor / proline dehydrogenase / delta 1-pyrroline-5-carboxylate dehydrogenase
VLQLGIWRAEELPKLRAAPASPVAELLEHCIAQIEDEADQAILRASAASYAWAWQTHFGRAHDPSQLLGEINLFRYRPSGRVMLCIGEEPSQVAVAQVVLATTTTGTRLVISGRQLTGWLWLKELGVEMVEEDDSARIGRLANGTHAVERLRLLEPPPISLRQAANHACVDIIDAPALANGRLELRHYLREQAVSQTVHRYGNPMGVYEQP